MKHGWYWILPPLMLAIYWWYRPRDLHRKNIRTARRIIRKCKRLPASQVLDYLRGIDPYVFEEVVLTAFRYAGYKPIRSRRYTGDGGVDGYIKTPAGLCLPVQAKRYSGHIHAKHVRSFVKLVKKQKIPVGFFVHTGKTGKAAYQYAGDKVLIIGETLLVTLVLGFPLPSLEAKHLQKHYPQELRRVRVKKWRKIVVLGLLLVAVLAILMRTGF